MSAAPRRRVCCRAAAASGNGKRTGKDEGRAWRRLPARCACDVAGQQRPAVHHPSPHAPTSPEAAVHHAAPRYAGRLRRPRAPAPTWPASTAHCSWRLGIADVPAERFAASSMKPRREHLTAAAGRTEEWGGQEAGRTVCAVGGRLLQQRVSTSLRF